MWERANGTIPGMIAHSLPFYYGDGYIDKHRVLFMPRSGMTLEEMLRNSAHEKNKLPFLKKLLLILLKIVRFELVFQNRSSRLKLINIPAFRFFIF